MKTFKIETTSIQKNKVDASLGYLTYKDLVLESLEVVPEKGFKLRDLDLRLKIKKSFESSTDTVELEDEQAKELLQCIDSMPWAMLHEDILGFINSAKEQLS